LRYRDLEEMMCERGLQVDHTTIYCWVQRYAPELEKRCRPHLKPCNDSWKVDETYIKVRKSWMYLYRAVDSEVTELLDWPYWEVRMQAAETLGELCRNIPDAAIRRLLALRRDPDPLMKSVREAADDALAEILSLEDGIEDD
jgi:hypothetical protein